MVRWSWFVLFSLLLLYGCSTIGPPTDYYQKALEMEEYGEQARRDTGRRPSDILTLPENPPETTKIVKIPVQEPPIQELVPKPSQQQDKELLSVKSDRIQEELKESLHKEIALESPLPSGSILSTGPRPVTEPIAVSSDVVKSALEFAGIRVKAVELVNGRLSGGRNSVRINFLCGSVSLVNDKFFTMCAVVYHLDKSANTIDVVVGIAEDSQANLTGILQTNTEDITAWMTNKITRAEWLSRITKKML